MITWFHGILRHQLVTSAKELLVIRHTEIERGLAIGIEVSILSPIGYLCTSRT